MIILTIIVSMISGGLSGACVNVFFNRRFHRTQVRKELYPKVSDLYAAYLIRLEKSGGQNLVQIADGPISAADHAFIDRRTTFIGDLVQFSELNEVRILRKQLWDNMSKTAGGSGTISNLDLAPEADALRSCLGTLHKKLRLEA